MNVTNLNLKGLLLIKPVIYEDERGYFQEIYHTEKYQNYLPQGTLFVQDNVSYSKYGTIRGLHFQKEPYEQAKLLRCVLGAILDVVVDLRTGSPTFGKYEYVELSSENNLQLFVPKGFAHGFSVLSKEALVEYKCDEFYNSQSETGIRFDDPSLNIDWKIPHKDIIVSEKDANLPFLISELVE